MNVEGTRRLLEACAAGDGARFVFASTVVTGEARPIHRGRRTQVWQTRITTAEPGTAPGLYLVVSDAEEARQELLARGAGVSDGEDARRAARMDGTASSSIVAR